jgi:hypothetical protein
LLPNNSGIVNNPRSVPNLLFGERENGSIKSLATSCSFLFGGGIVSFLPNLFPNLEKHLYSNLELQLGARVHQGINGYSANPWFHLNHLAQK